MPADPRSSTSSHTRKPWHKVSWELGGCKKRTRNIEHKSGKTKSPKSFKKKKNGKKTARPGTHFAADWYRDACRAADDHLRAVLPSALPKPHWSRLYACWHIERHHRPTTTTTGKVFMRIRERDSRKKGRPVKRKRICSYNSWRQRPFVRTKNTRIDLLDRA